MTCISWNRGRYPPQNPPVTPKTRTPRRLLLTLSQGEREGQAAINPSTIRSSFHKRDFQSTSYYTSMVTNRFYLGDKASSAGGARTRSLTNLYCHCLRQCHSLCGNNDIPVTLSASAIIVVCVQWRHYWSLFPSSPWRIYRLITAQRSVATPSYWFLPLPGDAKVSGLFVPLTIRTMDCSYHRPFVPHILFCHCVFAGSRVTVVTNLPAYINNVMWRFCLHLCFSVRWFL